jgi:hypothetical protein
MADDAKRIPVRTADFIAVILLTHLDEENHAMGFDA